LTDNWLSYFFTEEEIYGAAEYTAPAVKVLQVASEIIDIIEPVIPFADEIFEVAVEVGGRFGKALSPLLGAGDPGHLDTLTNPFDLGRTKAFQQPSRDRDVWTTNVVQPVADPNPTLTDFIDEGAPGYDFGPSAAPAPAPAPAPPPGPRYEPRSRPMANGHGLMPFFGIAYDTPEEPPADIVAYTWNTGTAIFYRLIDGKIAVRKKNGVWKIYRPPKMLVISNKPRLPDFNRAVTKLGRMSDRLEKSFKTMNKTRKKK